MTYYEKIVEAITGKETLREFTPDEVAALEAEQARLQTEQAAKNAEQATKDAARQAVLDKLGLTADEIAALLG